MRSRRRAAGPTSVITQLAEQVQAPAWGCGARPRRGDRVAILSENRPEWAITDYACLAARCTDVPIYPTLPARQAEYILRDSGAVAVFVSTAAQLEKCARDPRRAAGAPHVDRRSTPGVRGPDVLSFGAVAGLRARGASPPPGLARPRARRRPGRSRHADLYLGHHRRPQGRDADARQHRVERDQLRRAVRSHATSDECLSLPAAVPHLRADGGPLLDVPRRAC